MSGQQAGPHATVQSVAIDLDKLCAIYRRSLQLNRAALLNHATQKLGLSLKQGADHIDAMIEILVTTFRGGIVAQAQAQAALAELQKQRGGLATPAPPRVLRPS